MHWVIVIRGLAQQQQTSIVTVDFMAQARSGAEPREVQGGGKLDLMTHRPTRFSIFWALRGMAWLFATLLMFLIAPLATAQPFDVWTGEWQSFWRGGAAVLVLKQDGARVTGTFQPGNGRIEGQVEDHILRGMWIEGDVSGGLIFALSGDGQTFSGRYDSGEYWNGRRVTAGTEGPPPFDSDASPREVVRSFVAAMNEFTGAGDVGALRFSQSFLDYEGDSSDQRELARRRALLWDLFDLSTFRVYDAPPRPEGDIATFRIGPAGAEATYAVPFRKRHDGDWRIVVESESELTQAVRRFLDALGQPSVAAARDASADSPRGVMDRFLQGVHAWESGGGEKVLQTFDLSFLPPHVRAGEGPILADYLKRIIDGAGYVILQEIPDNADRATPYVHYEHPLGDVVIARRPTREDGAARRWTFTAGTLRTAPALFNAIQDLPPAAGLAPQPPLTRFFLLRERIRAAMPQLLHRKVILETWQWIWIAGASALAGLLWFFMGWVRRIVPGASDPRHFGTADLSQHASEIADSGPGESWFPRRSLLFAARVAAAGLFLSWSLGWIGLVETPLALAYRIAVMVAVTGVTWLTYEVAGLLGGILLRKAQATTEYADEIVTSLATGVVKLAIVVGGILALAEIVDLPYEGVLAGLGVSGIALAFAARETVANMLGGMLVLTDRPFKRGDLIETRDGHLATVEAVGLRSTRLKRLDDTIMIIPNTHLSDSTIINWGVRHRRRIDLEFALPFDIPRERIDRFVSELADLVRAQPRTDSEDCYVGLKDFGASAVTIECRCFFRVYSYEAQVRARHALIGDVLDLADRLGVSFAFPTRTVHLLNAPGSASEVSPSRPA